MLIIEPSSLGMASTEVSSTRGSHLATASYTACSITPSVLGLTGANTCSHILQPKSGRITRSPGAVVRIIRSAASISSPPLTNRTLPPGVICPGNAHPDPIRSACPCAGSAITVATPLVQLDRFAGHGQRGLGGDVHRGRVQRHLLAGLDLDLVGRDGQLLLAGELGLGLL